jgi:predicted signal transduction protein with EAL and GGDEF domain
VGWVRDEREERRGNRLALPQQAPPRRFTAAGAVVLVVALAFVVAFSCVAVGFSFARLSDEQRAAEQRNSLRAAVSEFRALFGNGNEVDPRFIRMIEQGTGLKNVRFESEPANPSREIQPVANAEGRLVGFLSWQPDAPMTALMKNLTPLIAGGVFGAMFFIGLSAWQLRRSRFALEQTEQKVREASERDALTALPNDAKLARLLEKALTQDDGRIVTYALMSLGGLETIAESYGQQGADEIIGVVAARLRDAVPPDVTCGRVGDRIFGLVWESDRDAEMFMRQMIDLAARPHWIDTMVRLRACAGFARAPEHATTRDELVRRAELALRAAEKKGIGAVVAFDRAFDDSASEMHFIRRELPRALAAQALDVHYQPIVAADTGRIIGVEALLRWTHKDRGAISPAHFVAVAEQMGLMVDLGAFVLRRALRDARNWPALYVSVNLSPLQARDRGIIDVVREALRESGIAHTRLVLEITEGVLIDNPEDMLKRIAELRAIGVRIALDDFGSGYSSLGYLQRFAFDKLKLDKSFVSALGRSANAAVIIQAVVALGRALGVTVVVEGVETEEQRVLLRLAGCDEMQGFLFAKPAPAEAIVHLLGKAKNQAAAMA